ncbi:helix-turn-helix domain-containing protein [Streptomyces nodosus]|uniref:helix-turn-helix domain-containing protein n=1 Tax=Streptomyces nodosus TaxID=40318 RepID=UPI0036E98E0B
MRQPTMTAASGGQQRYKSSNQDRRAAVVGNGIAAELALRLRALRDTSGLSLRQLADRTGYSTAVLSTAESGRRTPTWEVIAAFVTGCGGNALEWKQLWDVAAGHWLLPNPPRALRDSEPPSAEAAESGPADDEAGADGEEAGAVDGRRTGHRRWIAVAAALVIVAAGPTTFGLTRSGSHQGGTADAQLDGKDPRAKGCRDDQTQVSSAPIHAYYGALQLMYSLACQTAWARTDGRNSHLFAIHLSVVRPADAARSDYSSQLDYPAPGSWGNMLTTGPGCVLAEAWITEKGKPTGPRAKTSCVQGVGPVTHGSASPAHDGVRGSVRSSVLAHIRW